MCKFVSTINTIGMITYPSVKINLGLNVLRKREDGYHDLETLFYPYRKIHDTLEIIAGDDYSRTSARLMALYSDLDMGIAQGISDDGKLMITVARKEGIDWPVLKDLTVKAYQILDKDFDLPPVKIYLEKTSPVGAGLGGGSSDAAFALKMLDEMFSLGLGQNKLAEYASEIGSDCAFFIWDKPMFGEGRGEKLSPYELDINIIEDSSTDCMDSSAMNGVKGPSENNSAVPDIYELQVLVPEGIHVSTAEAYKGINPTMPEHSLKEVLERPVSEWKDLLTNDFEKTVFLRYPELAAIKQSLYDSGAVYASMSGSGSGMFALYRK